MAAKLKRWEWRKAMLASDLSDGAKVVLSAVHDFVNEASGKAWPSVATLMKATGKKERAVQRAIAEARIAGWIIYTERPGTTSLIQIALPEGVSFVAPLSEVGGVNIGTPGGVISDTPGVSLLAPEPSIEPSILNHPSKSADAEGHRMEEKKEAIALPIAGFDERMSWSTMWPASQSIEFRETHNDEAQWTRIVNAALEILGWNQKGSHWDRSAWSAINDALKSFEYRNALLMRYASGRLTTDDLANVLAHAGINPPAIINEGKSNEAAA